MHVRHVSRLARRTVDVLLEYDPITTYALGALGAILKTGLGLYTTIPKLNSVLNLWRVWRFHDTSNMLNVLFSVH